MHFWETYFKIIIIITSNIINKRFLIWFVCLSDFFVRARSISYKCSLNILKLMYVIHVLYWKCCGEWSRNHGVCTEIGQKMSDALRWMGRNFKKYILACLYRTKYNEINNNDSDMQKYICYENGIKSLIFWVQDLTNDYEYNMRSG